MEGEAPAEPLLCVSRLGGSLALHFLASWLGGSLALHFLVSWLGGSLALHFLVSWLGGSLALPLIANPTFSPHIPALACPHPSGGR